jgi:hypothetical protein
MFPRSERRKFERYRPKDGTMAVNHHALGPVVNISMGGLSFQYTGKDSFTPTSNILGIFLGSDDLLIDKINTRVVEDRLVSQGSAFLKASTRQCSIEFTTLTSSQRSNLENFINNKTTGAYTSPLS